MIMVKNVITVMSYNVNGLRDQAKHRAVISQVIYSDQRTVPDIVFLQETHSNRKCV